MIVLLVLVGLLLSGVLGVVLLRRRRADRATAVPFGPGMPVGARLGALAGEPMAEGCLRFTGPA